MKRIKTIRRENWQKKVSELGLVYHTISYNKPYWDESAYYRFSSKEVDSLETATNELQRLCLEAGQHIIDKDRFSEFGIPKAAIPSIKWAWNSEPPAIYGRFDFAYDGQNPPKLLEYNADTPTSLLEASVVQWHWLKEKFPSADQFNSIHERLVAKWKELQEYLAGATLYFAHVDDSSLEDTMTVTYLRDTAHEGGINSTQPILVKDIGWNSKKDRFVDLDEKPIVSIFKLYPWEWMLNEEFGQHALDTYKEMQWIEPIWKMLFSNKGILPVLWELFPNHPNLLEAYFHDPHGMTDYVRKPLMSREGANIRIVNGGTVRQETDGDYGEEGYIFQSLCPIPSFDGHRPVIGSWIIDGEAAGMGIRETESFVTDNLSSFAPHLFE